MDFALFVPCDIGHFFSGVAIATLELLERQGVKVHFPKDQTWCGQPMANTGCEVMWRRWLASLLSCSKGMTW
ncbi:Cysteine-rich domain-containing protein [Neorhodopirellula lusitana]|uniref:Cysteine-rich domain-containing protein n=1 Tax=Neorhodopirellula lusitana TaxID=445327 RepID=A0ABY1PYG9_9BACT|nr:(Fe-S)-binding protein [Neorhodopirellula lusitana]SMP50715.1 Cysteine-rich domain-containing protein [Neorhodopirellula lusitana]